MQDIIGDIRSSVRRLSGELENFQEIARHIRPNAGEIPQLDGLDIYGQTIPLNGVIGGDHIVYVDFNKRYDLDARIEQAKKQGNLAIAKALAGCRNKAGIGILDVSGHQITDALLAAMMHQSFLLGVIYELDYSGNITERLFENINTRFYNSSAVSKFLTLLYGEIYVDGTFKFLSAAHPPPVVFSQKYDKIVTIPQPVSFPPIGTLPSQSDIDRRNTKSVLGYKDPYRVNEIDLIGSGDIMLIYTDGLMEHMKGDEEYFPGRVEEIFHRHKKDSAFVIFEALKEDVLSFAEPTDDISYVVIKRESL
jgi:serine phosphatase RsbU (regulator of sigma subunit)